MKNIWNFEYSVEQYQTIGGTSLSAVREQISVLENWLKNQKKISSHWYENNKMDMSSLSIDL